MQLYTFSQINDKFLQDFSAVCREIWYVWALLADSSDQGFETPGPMIFSKLSSTVTAAGASEVEGGAALTLS